MVADPWAPTAEDIERYDGFFALCDPEKTGFVTGVQAKPLFDRSELPQEALAHVWELSDCDGDSMLSRHEFHAAMHLTTLALDGVPLPPTLPAALAPAAVGNRGIPAAELRQYRAVYMANEDTTYGGLTALAAAQLIAQVREPSWTAGRRAVRASRGTLLLAYPYPCADLPRASLQSGLPPEPDLSHIWDLADLDHDGELNIDEFCLAMHLAARRASGEPLQAAVPPELLPPYGWDTEDAAAVFTTVPGLGDVAVSGGAPGHFAARAPGYGDFGASGCASPHVRGGDYGGSRGLLPPHTLPPGIVPAHSPVRLDACAAAGGAGFAGVAMVANTVHEAVDRFLMSTKERASYERAAKSVKAGSAGFVDTEKVPTTSQPGVPGESILCGARPKRGALCARPPPPPAHDTQARALLAKSKRSKKEINAIWELADVDRDGKEGRGRHTYRTPPAAHSVSTARRPSLPFARAPVHPVPVPTFRPVRCAGVLSVGEFCVAMHLITMLKKGDPIPSILPAALHEEAMRTTSSTVPPSPAMRSACPSPGHAAPAVGGAEAWTLSAEQRLLYSTAFEGGADGDRMDVERARRHMTRAGLAKERVDDVIALVAPGGGRLDDAQFMVAMLVTTKVTEGSVLPSQLPPRLSAMVEGHEEPPLAAQCAPIVSPSAQVSVSPLVPPATGVDEPAPVACGAASESGRVQPSGGAQPNPADEATNRRRKLQRQESAQLSLEVDLLSLSP